MDGRDIHELAERRAAQYAPKPDYDPVHAGGVGAVIVGLALAAFLAFARLDQDAFAGAIGLTIALGFGVPYAYLKYLEHRHSKAFAKEYGNIIKSTNAQRP